MTCARRDSMLMALHCGEPARADCAECEAALADERRFVDAVEAGLAGVGPMTSIAAFVRRRIVKPRRKTSLAPFAIAAAALLAAIVAVVAFNPKPPAQAVVHHPEPKRVVQPEPPKPEPVRDVPKPAPEPTPEPKPEPAPEPKPDPMPEPRPEPKPQPEPEPTPDVKPERPTVEAPAPAQIAAILKSGTISVKGKKLAAGAVALESSAEFKAEGRARLEIAGAVITFDSGSKASLIAGDVVGVALGEGEILLDAPASARIELKLAADVRSATSAGRFVAVARPDAVLVLEGGAVSGRALLVEGKQYRIDSEPAAVKRTLGDKWRASLAREVVTWRLDFDSGKPPAGTTIEGTFAQRALKTSKLDKNPYFWGGAYLLSDEKKLFTAKATTHLRFRYLIRKPTRLMIQAHDMAYDENFEIAIPDPVIGEWTTVTLRVMDLPANPGGQKVSVGAGDVFSWVRWLVGTPEAEGEAVIDDVQIVEISR